MFDFDACVSKLDEVHQNMFGILVEIDGNEYTGVFDEVPDQFEGVDTMVRTLEIPVSDLSSVNIENDITKVKLLTDDRIFTVHLHEPVDTQMVMELR
jgi:hypothetical protein